MTALNGDSEVILYDLPERRLALAGARLSRRLEHCKGVWRLELPREGKAHVVEQLGGPVTPPPEHTAAVPPGPIAHPRRLVEGVFEVVVDVRPRPEVNG